MMSTQTVSRSKSVFTAALCGFFSSPLCMASVESSLSAVQSKLINTVLPLAGIVGLAIAGIEGPVPLTKG